MFRDDHFPDCRLLSWRRQMIKKFHQLRRCFEPDSARAECLCKGEIVPGGQHVVWGERSTRLKGLQVHECLFDSVPAIAHHEDHGVAPGLSEARDLLTIHHETAIARYHQRALAAAERNTKS